VAHRLDDTNGQLLQQGFVAAGQHISNKFTTVQR